MDTHKNARLTPKGREEMVRAVVDRGMSKAASARQFNTRNAAIAASRSCPFSRFRQRDFFSAERPKDAAKKRPRSSRGRS